MLQITKTGRESRHGTRNSNGGKFRTPFGGSSFPVVSGRDLVDLGDARMVLIRRSLQRIAVTAILVTSAACANESVTGPGAKNRVAFTPVPVYFNDFSSGAGAGWSQSRTSTAPLGEKFLGEYGNDSVALTLTGLAPHDSLAVAFDFYIIRSWDGVDPVWGGPDVVTVFVDDIRRGVSSFSNIPGNDQNFPDATVSGITHPALSGATAINSLGYTYWSSNVAIDASYHYEFTIPHTSSTMVIAFQGQGLQPLTDESWGVDNLSFAIITIGS